MVRIWKVCDIECTDGVSNDKNRVPELHGAVRGEPLHRTDGPLIQSVSE